MAPWVTRARFPQARSVAFSYISSGRSALVHQLSSVSRWSLSALTLNCNSRLGTHWSAPWLPPTGRLYNKARLAKNTLSPLVIGGIRSLRHLGASEFCSRFDRPWTLPSVRTKLTKPAFLEQKRAASCHPRAAKANCATNSGERPPRATAARSRHRKASSRRPTRR